MVPDRSMTARLGGQLVAAQVKEVLCLHEIGRVQPFRKADIDGCEQLDAFYFWSSPAGRVASPAAARS